LHGRHPARRRPGSLGQRPSRSSVAASRRQRGRTLTFSSRKT
jgi:ribosomal protein L3